MINIETMHLFSRKKKKKENREKCKLYRNGIYIISISICSHIYRNINVLSRI